MKVTLDLTRLLAEGDIDQAEFDKLSRLSRAETGSLAFNILVGLGVVAVGGATLALVPTPMTAIVIGIVLMAAGLAVLLSQPAWLVLANILILVAALMFGGGVLVQSGGAPLAYIAVAAIFAAAGLVARSGLLTALAVIALGGTIGAGTFYSHARYGLFIAQPALTILVFSSIALVTFMVSNRLSPDYERLALIASRTSVFIVNIGFWIGSLWGDALTWLHRASTAEEAEKWAAKTVITDTAFAVAWALALLAVGTWATSVDRRWVVNLAAVFGAILFYTQWFERLDATPVSVLIAGLITLAIAVALWKWNHRKLPDQAHGAA